jgi:hypothetical protein
VRKYLVNVVGSIVNPLCHAVGNVPYTMGEEQLINTFKSVGQVVGFRYCHLHLNSCL